MEELTIAEAAQCLARSTVWTRKLCEQGVLAARKIGAGRRGQWLVQAAAVQCLLEEWASHPPQAGRPHKIQDESYTP